MPALNAMVQAIPGGGKVVSDVNSWQSVVGAAVAGGVVALVSFMQNELERVTGTTVLFK